MTRRFDDGERVFVPSRRIADDLTSGKADVNKADPLLRGTVVKRMPDQRSYTVMVRAPDAKNPGQSRDVTVSSVSSKNIRADGSTLIIEIGDLLTEQTLLSPLANALADGLSLLMPFGSLVRERARTLPGFALLWEHYAPAVSQLILVGHGRPNGILFGRHWADATEFVERMEPFAPARGFRELKVISVCCQTGSGELAKDVTRQLGCSWVGPTRDALGFECAIFVQALYAAHFCAGYQWATAVEKAKAVIPAAFEYRGTAQAHWDIWTGGKRHSSARPRKA
jgi:hypothetical protein